MPWNTYRMIQGHNDTAFMVFCIVVCAVVLVAFGIMLYKIRKDK